jgi:hypothetical protein
MIERRGRPLEGTNMSLFNSHHPELVAGERHRVTMYGNAQLAERVWVANRCQQMNAQQIASMPLEFHGGPDEPAWVSSPDPNWFPNGIGDAMHAIVDQMYGWGFSCQYVTDFYADGFPRTWTVLPSASGERSVEDGAREYKLGETSWIRGGRADRPEPRDAGCTALSALRAYAQLAYGLLAAGNQSMTVSEGGIPQALIKADGKLDEGAGGGDPDEVDGGDARRNGAPPVLGKDLDFVRRCRSTRPTWRCWRRRSSTRRRSRPRTGSRRCC